MINFEYAQQIEHLKMSVDEIKKMLDSKNVLYAYIIHDKDKKEDGETLVKPHIHIMVRMLSDASAETVAKWFKDEKQFINTKNKKTHWENKLLYLIHKSKSSIDDTNKYKYSPDDVVSNFDYKYEIEKAIEKNQAKENMQNILVMISSGVIPPSEILNHIDDITYINNYQKIERAIKVANKKASTKTDRNISVIYISGSSGLGKTTLAKDICKKRNLDMFISSSSNDVLDSYEGQKAIILDDFRDNQLEFSDLLKLLDNHTNSTVKSRYYNKIIRANLIIITSIIPLEHLYPYNFEDKKQLYRRIGSYINVDKNKIKIYSYNNDLNGYELKSEKNNYIYFKYVESYDAIFNNKNEQLSEELTNDIDSISKSEV